jgi:uncharacterized membrane protein
MWAVTALLKQFLTEERKNEMYALGVGFIVLAAILLAGFKASPWLDVLRTAAALYWMFVIPGYALALCSKQGFVERLILGITVQVALFGLLSYYAGLAGWHVATHGLILPLFSIAAGIFLWKKSEK